MQMADDYHGHNGFDVVCTIGRVEFSQVGTTHPRVAAFELIAGHGADGHFTFPDEDGSILHVDVSHQPTDSEPEGFDR